MAKRAAFQSLLQKFRPASKRSLVMVAEGMSAIVPSTSNSEPHFVQRYVKIVCPCFASASSTSVSQLGQFACTGRRTSCIPVSRSQIT